MLLLPSRWATSSYPEGYGEVVEKGWFKRPHTHTQVVPHVCPNAGRSIIDFFVVVVEIAFAR